MSLLGLLLVAPGCDSGCDQESVDRAVAFIDAHQACQTNDDCRVIDDFCGEIPGAVLCGQLSMNRQGAESEEWRAIEKELDGCAPDECTRCLAALEPRCNAGSCR